MSGTAPATLPGRRILVTGGSKGIGREIALAAAEAGAEVVVAARGDDAVQATVADLPGERSRLVCQWASISSAKPLRSPRSSSSRDCSPISLVRWRFCSMGSSSASVRCTWSVSSCAADRVDPLKNSRRLRRSLSSVSRDNWSGSTSTVPSRRNVYAHKPPWAAT